MKTLSDTYEALRTMDSQGFLKMLPFTASTDGEEQFGSVNGAFSNLLADPEGEGWND